MTEIHDQFNTILILDFELMPCTSKLTNLKYKLKGIILSRSPLHLPWPPGLVFLNISMDANSRRQVPRHGVLRLNEAWQVDQRSGGQPDRSGCF
ncbi:hypothetical protein C8R48DRAFT_727878 [Suillus tomentosus]|nr:hypothetical protein C8R48DRAFT_727878 [Suillus tomentosus]